jgi:hypothetical protein
MKYSFYIYYKVPEQIAADLRDRIHNLQTNITNAIGVTGKLLVKLNEPLLWMEVYENIDDHHIFSNALQKEISALGLADFFEYNPRKIEIFSEQK